MSDTQKDIQEGFAAKALNAIPPWALGALGLFMGVILTLQITGYNGAIVRIVEASTKRYEASAASLETSAKSFELIVSRVSSLETRVTALELNAARVDQKYHSSGTK
jgi:trehalose-6-phosphatase